MTAARDLHISGIVQGVGFRPFVYRQARRWGLVGWVLNAGDGVHVHIEGDRASLDGFVGELGTRAPAASLIASTQVTEGHVEGPEGFVIRASDEEGGRSTLVSPDIATCPQCLKELFDPDDRRFHYPFINCTNCGPRFTIIDALPYDRPHTSMASFTMCADCGREYRDPLDRRFHAQPDACFSCGPTLRLWEAGALSGGAAGAWGREESDALIAKAASLLAQGRIVAIKGLGGYHLACDATNEDAVARLRRRKRRSAKPFALMVRSVADARALCEVDEQEAALLAGTVRPIVLLRRRGTGAEDGAGAQAEGGAPRADRHSSPLRETGTDTGARAGASGAEPPTIAPSVAGTLHELGVMLPSTPVQHLLMAAVATPLVMTSGNISEEPIIACEAAAHDALADVADAFLDNDREVLSRYDDSVVRVVRDRVLFVRRARGYAPLPLQLAQRGTSAHILAVGPEQKSTFCLVRGEEAFVSQHLGDLENSSSFQAWHSTLALYRRLFDLDYEVLAHDLHPEYLSTKWAHAQGAGCVEVQHHHAHIASVLAEAAEDGGAGGRVIGIAFDGSGYGEDGTIWGGEALVATLEGFERFAHLRPVPLPGARAAIDCPDRMAWSYLRTLGLAEHPGASALVAGIGPDRLLLLDQVVAGRINSPLTSSMGRLFDAASALAGICTTNSYEGQAAVEMEAALCDPATGRPVADPQGSHAAERYRFSLSDADTPSQAGADEARDGASPPEREQGGQKPAGPPVLIDPAPVLRALLDDRAALVPPSLVALRFHEAVVQLVVELCKKARSRYGLAVVALSGGVFMNRHLLTRTVPLLEQAGFTVLLNQSLPANDGCISYGQAAVAAARLARRADEGVLLEASGGTDRTAPSALSGRA
ncbi:MAG: carbamoyltransferase HypF [Coriobacteriales bacterium]|jgi:hydrogenase maturation protein HypF|nr:carbamoyltransferase HypF [Coriobacteriales bacterium]